MNGKKIAVFCATAALVLFADQGIKALLRTYPKGTVIFKGRILEIVSIRNSGAAFGLLAEQPFFLISLGGILLLLVLFSAWKVFSSHERVWAALLFGGALGNLMDRAVFGQVTDYIHVYGFSVFNLADICITLSCAALALGVLREKKNGGND